MSSGISSVVFMAAERVPYLWVYGNSLSSRVSSWGRVAEGSVWITLYSLSRQRIQNRLEVEIHRSKRLTFYAPPFTIGKGESEPRVKACRVVIGIRIVERIRRHKPHSETRANLADDVAEHLAHQRGAHALCPLIHCEQTDLYCGKSAILHALILQKRMLKRDAIRQQCDVSRKPAVILSHKPTAGPRSRHFRAKCARASSRSKTQDASGETRLRPAGRADRAFRRNLRRRSFFALASATRRTFEVRDNLRSKRLCTRIRHRTPRIEQAQHPACFRARDGQ